jgi:hypothetical protein
VCCPWHVGGMTRVLASGTWALPVFDLTRLVLSCLVLIGRGCSRMLVSASWGALVLETGALPIELLPWIPCRKY